MTTPSTLIDPRLAALLVMDYQPAILGSLQETSALIDRVSDAIAIARRRGVHVGFVRVALDEEDVRAIPEHAPFAAMVAGGAEHLHPAAPSTAIHERIAPASGDITVRKTRIGAFSTTDLDAQLRRRGITTLILAGVATSGVVLSTVRDAFDHDYRVLVLADAGADPRPEVHDFLIDHILPFQAQIIEVAELDALLASERDAA